MAALQVLTYCDGCDNGTVWHYAVNVFVFSRINTMIKYVLVKSTQIMHTLFDKCQKVLMCIIELDQAMVQRIKIKLNCEVQASIGLSFCCFF